MGSPYIFTDLIFYEMACPKVGVSLSAEECHLLGRPRLSLRQKSESSRIAPVSPIARLPWLTSRPGTR